MIIIGIDPGQTGAIAMVDESQSLYISDMPTIDKDLDIDEFMGILKCEKEAHVFLEKAQPMPRQKGMFTYGKMYGSIIAILHIMGFPYTLVRPQEWKKEMLKGMDRAKKESSIIRAKQLYPQSEYFKRKKDHNRAEAALIAEYGRRQM